MTDNFEEFDKLTDEEKAEFAQAILADLVERGEIDIVHLNIEEIQGNLYAWNVETNEFLGQGATQTELFERLADRAQGNTMYRIAKDHGGQMLRDKGLTN